MNAILASLFAITAYAGHVSANMLQPIGTPVKVEAGKPVKDIYPFTNGAGFALATDAGLDVYHVNGTKITSITGGITGNTVGYVAPHVYYVSGGQLRQHHTSGASASLTVDLGFPVAEVPNFHFAVSKKYIAYTKLVGTFGKEVKIVVADIAKPKTAKWTLDLKKTASKDKAYDVIALQIDDNDQLIVSYKYAVQVYKVGETKPQIDARVSVLNAAPIACDYYTTLFVPVHKEGTARALVGKANEKDGFFHVKKETEHKFAAPLKDGKMIIDGPGHLLLVFEKAAQSVEIRKYDLNK